MFCSDYLSERGSKALSFRWFAGTLRCLFCATLVAIVGSFRINNRLAVGASFSADFRLAAHLNSNNSGGNGNDSIAGDHE